MTRLDSPVALKHKQLLWKQQQGFQMSSFSTQVSEEHDPAAQGRTRKIEKSVLLCGISVKQI